MISFHKWIVAMVLVALALIAGVGQWVFYRDMSQVRSQANAEIKEAVEAANRQIDHVREEAAKVAIDEARKRVDDAFRTQNIQEMIEAAAKRQLGPAIDRRVRQELDVFATGVQDQISSLGEITDLAAKMRIGIRSGLNDLSLKAKSAANENDRRMAQALLSTVSADYDSVWRRNLRRDGLTAENALFGATRFRFNPSNPHPVPAIVTMIREEPDLNVVALSFLALTDSTGHQFRMFDIDGVEQWCKEHSPICTEPNPKK
jgi:hypothetical protein